MTTKKSTPKKKNSSEIERYVDKLFIECDVGNGFWFEAYVDDAVYDVNADLNSISKKLTEESVYNAIKNSPSFKKALDRTMKDAVNNIISSTRYAQKELEREAAYIAERAKTVEAQRLKQVAINKGIAEKIKKESAQINIFKEGLSAAQKKAFKKFYGVDVEKSKSKLANTLPHFDAPYDDYDD